MKIKDRRRKRYLRGRKKSLGTKQRPRLCLFRSLNNMTAQLIDDVEGKTLLTVSTLDKVIREKFSQPKVDQPQAGAKGGKHRGNVAASGALGELLAQRALKTNIKQVRFDRSGYLYHGRVKEFAEACRKAGLQF